MRSKLIQLSYHLSIAGDPLNWIVSHFKPACLKVSNSSSSMTAVDA